MVILYPVADDPRFWALCAAIFMGIGVVLNLSFDDGEMLTFLVFLFGAACGFVAWQKERRE